MPIRRSPNDARHPIHRVVAITRNRWSRSIGMTGRNQSERLVAIIRYAHTLSQRFSPGCIDPRGRCQQARSQQNASQRIMPLIWPE